MRTFTTPIPRSVTTSILMLVGCLTWLGLSRAHAQAEGEVPYDETTDRYTYTAAVAAPDVSGDSLYHNALYFLEHVTGDGEFEEVKAHETIRDRIPMAVKSRATGDTLEAHFDLTLTFRDERYDYKISNITIRDEGSSTERRPLEEVLKPHGNRDTDHERDIAESLDQSVERFMEDLRRALLHQDILRFNDTTGERKPEVHPRDN